MEIEDVMHDFNVTDKGLTPQEVQERLDQKMTRAFHGVYQMYLQEKVNMRQAAYLVSVARVAEACKLRGWV
jgi:glutamate dehydrogenase (NAD(P)+)